METTNAQTLQSNLSKLTIEDLDDGEIVVNYPYLMEFMEKLNNDFPEISMVLGRQELNSLILSKYIETYQQYITNKTVGDYNEESLNELFRETLNEDLTVSYYSEVKDILETNFQELYEEIEQNTPTVEKAIYAALAAEVYKEINGNQVQETIYIPPYTDGYNDQERNLIREVLSSIINKMFTEDEDLHNNHI